MRVMCKSVVLEARNMYGLRRNSSVYVYFFCVHESRTTVADAGSDLESSTRRGGYNSSGGSVTTRFR